MSLLIAALPQEMAEAHQNLDAALEKRSSLQRQAAEFAAAEPVATRAREAARTALDEAETDFDLATDENEKPLRSARDQRRRELAGAEEELQRVQRIRRGVAARLAEADREIEATHAPFRKVLEQFGAEVCMDLYRPRLVEASASLARELRLGYAIRDALPCNGLLGVALGDASVRDIGPQPGRPVARLILGEQHWLNESDGAAGASLRDFKDDPEIEAVHRLLRPLAVSDAAATMRLRAIAAEARRDPSPAAAKPDWTPPKPMTRAEHEAWLAAQPTVEEHRAEMAKMRAEALPKVTPPVEHTYHGPNFGRLA